MPNFQVAQSVQSSKLKSAWLAKKRWIAAPMPCAWGNRQLATNKFKVKAAEGIWCPITSKNQSARCARNVQRTAPWDSAWHSTMISAVCWSPLKLHNQLQLPAAASSCQQLPASDPASSLSSCSCFSSSALRCCRRFRSCFDGSPHSFQQKEEIVGIENLRCVLSLAVSFSWPGKLPLMIQMQAIAVQ